MVPRLLFAAFQSQASARYTVAMPATAEQLWDAIERLAHEDGTADRIQSAIITRLIELKLAQRSGGLPQLTPCGIKCYIEMGSGEAVLPKLNDLIAIEDQTRQRVE